MIKILLTTMLFLEVSIYDHTVSSVSGNQIDFNDFRGKKILVVNIATSGPRVSQIGELQQLHEQFGDSLIIIGFPSNSFGHETRSNSEIQQFCQTEYETTFLLAAKGSVKGDDIQSFYYWLTTKTQNGIFENSIQGDFQKYLFDESGNPLGLFTGRVSPLSTELINAITGTQN